jgi:Fur family ferric uptake transcriptional regulator
VTVSHSSPVISAPDVESACAAVRARGLRLTIPRRLVIEALFRGSVPVTAQEIADGPDAAAPGMDVAAVYRNLEVLERIGLVRHVHAGHGPGLYMLADRVESEYLQCERCGQLQAVEPSVLATARREIVEATGFEPRFSHFPLAGLCPDCVRSERGAG